MAGERMQMVWRECWKEYRKAGRAEKSRLLDDLCRRTGYNRKYLIGLLKMPPDEKGVKRRRRRRKYSDDAVRVLEVIWKAAGYPWSVRLKAMLPHWLPWAGKRLPYCTSEVQSAVLSISPRQIDRYLAPKRRAVRKRIYGRTKPGTLLRRQIPVMTQHWDVDGPGFMEADTVSHSGPSATGEWIRSLNMTDIYSGWVETMAVMGGSEHFATRAIDEIRMDLPFGLLGIDSDNGSEFINHHLLRYCQRGKIGFTRSRPYKKDDNAHIEQKNWTHVRKIFGWQRYDTYEQLDEMNALYRNDLRIIMNLFQPSVKLIEKHHVGSRVIRRYDAPQTPLDRLVAFYGEDHLPPKVAGLLASREKIDPFELSRKIDDALLRLNLPGRSDAEATRPESRPRAAPWNPPKETSNDKLPR